MGFWILVILFTLLLLAGPWWPYSRTWGYWPGGIVLAAMLLWLILLWFGLVVWYLPWVEGPPPVAG